MKVEIISRTQSLVEGVETQDLTAYIARIGKVKDNPARLLKYLIANKHWSPFSHTYFGFKVETSRSIGRQMIRHTSLSMQEWSQRYEDEVMGFEPIELRRKAEKNRQSSEDVFDPEIHEYTNASELIKQHLEDAETLYNSLIKAGVASECARFILPECTKTTLIFTGNIRSWIHFLELRLDHHTQKEARLVAEEIYTLLLKEIPVVFEALSNNGEQWNKKESTS